MLELPSDLRSLYFRELAIEEKSHWHLIRKIGAQHLAFLAKLFPLYNFGHNSGIDRNARCFCLEERPNRLCESLQSQLERLNLHLFFDGKVPLIF
ncbi:MAG: hypothetical protein HY069_02070 [Chlamydiia bacterium]|nr:hypothetical protein [Chlamydiia bacterium]